jgi:hypothetical protein
MLQAFVCLGTILEAFKGAWCARHSVSLSAMLKTICVFDAQVFHGVSTERLTLSQVMFWI